MQEMLTYLGAFILFVIVHHFSSRITYNEWTLGGEDYFPDQMDSDYFNKYRIPFYKKIFSLVVLAILVTLLAIFRSLNNFKMQQVMLTVLTLYCLFWFFIIFNTFVILRNRVRESLANLDSQLTRRSNLIENMVKIVKRYAKHEKDIFQNISRVRAGLKNTKADIPGAYASKEKSGELLGNLFAIAENYPDLKANQNFLDLQKELSRTETLIQSARSYYNDCVSEYNTQIELFPAKLIAKSGGFKRYEFFKGKKENKLAVKL